MFLEPVPVADDIWIIPRDTLPDSIQPNVGFIHLRDQTILIDAGNSPRRGRHIAALLAHMDYAPARTLIYTHHHWDHIFGASSFELDYIIGHEACAAAIRQMSSRSWTQASLRDEAQRNPRLQEVNHAISSAVNDWRSFKLIAPNLTFTTALTLYPETHRPIELLHVGGIHAPDSIVVRLPWAGVIFLGDCYYPRPPYERHPDEIDLDLVMLHSLLDQAYDVYIDGHGDPRSYAQMEELIEAEQARQLENQQESS